MSEAITNQKSNGRITAKSAGSQPAGQVHPLTLKYLKQTGYNTEGLSSKSWEVFELDVPDLVVTVCDNAKGEMCPLWLGNTPMVHWGLTDPSKLVVNDITEEGLSENDASNLQIEKAFKEVISTIEGRVDNLMKIAELPKEQWLMALEQEL